MKNVHLLILLAVTTLTGCSSLTTQQKLTQPREVSQARNDSERYILTFYPMAVEQMERYGIPASITLAQGLLESGAGKSKLATDGNNHFGIKADKRWNGKTMSSLDNGNWHKFRVYKDAAKSYEDHSKFLVDNSRYDFLFKLNRTDYKGWARGLKKAYYAEDREYDEKLISIIERYRLYEYDRYSVSDIRRSRNNETANTARLQKEILKANGLLYIVAEDGDTFRSLSKEFGISRRKLRKYNDLHKDYMFREGDIVYLQKKKNKATKGHQFHTTKEGESLYWISQIYGIKLKRIFKMNPQYISYTTLKVGDVIRLR